MNGMARRRGVRRIRGPALLVLVAVLAPGCQRRALFGEGGGPTGGGAQVELAGEDLAPVDALVHHSNAQWILGDEVEVIASREYFSPILTANAMPGHVRRDNETVGNEIQVRLTYVGVPGAASAMTNPRVLIGTGLTVSARHTILVRLVSTTDPSVPVRLRIVARGEASRGRGEVVDQRAAELVLGGVMRRGEACDYRWIPIG